MKHIQCGNDTVRHCICFTRYHITLAIGESLKKQNGIPSTFHAIVILLYYLLLPVHMPMQDNIDFVATNITLIVKLQFQVNMSGESCLISAPYPV